MSKILKLSIGLSLLILANGCTAGEGDGWVSGDLWLKNCKEGQSLEQTQGNFDLQVDFFAGEPVEDSYPDPSQRRNSLTLRLQNSSNNFEEADGISMQLTDVQQIAKKVAAGEVIPITYNGICNIGCVKTEDLVRANLYLYNSCPDCREPLAGINEQIGDDGQGCLRPIGAPAVCPTLTAEQKSQLEQICQQDFNSHDSYQTIGNLLGENSACIYFCRLGSVQAGTTAGNFDGFMVDYGDEVAALFSFNVVDTRAIRLQTCAQGRGHLKGMFKFEIQRGRVAQPFP